MTAVNALLVPLADALLAPLAGLPPLAVVAGCALGSALAVLAVMRATSNQAALATVKRHIHAALLEMRLYNDSLPALLRAQGEVLRHNLTYVGLSLVPLVITAVPLTLAIAQLQAWYGYAGFAPGTPVVVTATMAEAITPTALPRLEGTGVEVTSPPRYFPTLGEVTWRVVPSRPGTGTLRVVTSNGTVVDKAIHVASGDEVARRSPVRERPSLLGQLLYPSEPPIDDTAGVTAIHLHYPDRLLPVAGMDMPWLYAYLALTFAFVLLLRKPLGVVI